MAASTLPCKSNSKVRSEERKGNEGKTQIKIMGEFNGLTGVSKSKQAHFATSISGVIRAVGSGLAATNAGKEGSLTVWRDDSRVIRGSHERFRINLEERTFRSVREAAEWFMGKFALIEWEAD
jgi:hypothetical protein